MHNFEKTDSAKTLPKFELTIQENALAYGMLNEKADSTTNYVEEKGHRMHQNYKLQENDTGLLVEKFRSNPKDCLALARENLLAISADKRIDKNERKDRVSRYLDAYFELIIKLDSLAFPPSQEIKSGIPEYIPNGLVDMGSESSYEAALRTREKIVIDKKEIFNQSKDLLQDIFSTDLSYLDSSQLKNYFILRVATYVYEKMPYSYDKKVPETRSVPISDIRNRNLSVCRHHAIYAQVLMQTMGLTSRLMKCDVKFGDNHDFSSHASNLIRNNYDWYLLDVTNPDIKKISNDLDKKGEVFLRKLNEKSINLNEKQYNWEFQRNDGNINQYKTRNNMHYYIKDLRK